MLLLKTFIKIFKRRRIFFLFHLWILFSFIFLNLFFSSKKSFGGAYIKGGTFMKGMGGAGRASLDAYEGMLVNPALIKYSKPRSFAIFGNTQESSKELSYFNRSFGFTLIDNSVDNHFPAGISFFKNRKKQKGTKSSFSEYYFHLSLADIVYRRLMTGVSVYYLRSKEKNANQKNSTHKQFNLVWALHYAPLNQLGLSFIYYNLLPRKKNIPEAIQLLRQMSLGMQYIPMDFLRLRLDINYPAERNPKNKFIYQMGFETLSNKLISLRLGSELDFYKDKKFFTTGFSFNAPKFKLGFAMKRNFKKEKKDLEYSLDLKFSF